MNRPLSQITEASDAFINGGLKRALLQFFSFSIILNHSGILNLSALWILSCKPSNSEFSDWHLVFFWDYLKLFGWVFVGLRNKSAFFFWLFVFQKSDFFNFLVVFYLLKFNQVHFLSCRQFLEVETGLAWVGLILEFGTCWGIAHVHQFFKTGFGVLGWHFIWFWLEGVVFQMLIYQVRPVFAVVHRDQCLMRLSPCTEEIGSILTALEWALVKHSLGESQTVFKFEGLEQLLHFPAVLTLQ